MKAVNILTYFSRHLSLPSLSDVHSTVVTRPTKSGWWAVMLSSIPPPPFSLTGYMYYLSCSAPRSYRDRERKDHWEGRLPGCVLFIYMLSFSLVFDWTWSFCTHSSKCVLFTIRVICMYWVSVCTQTIDIKRASYLGEDLLWWSGLLFFLFA